MSIFDLLFITVFFASLITLLAAAVTAIGGRGGRSLRILRIYGICIGIYLGIVVLTSLILPRRILKLGDSRCFDDWCMSVENFRKSRQPTAISYVVTLRLSSRARRITQRENGVAVYLTDDQGRRVDPIPDRTAVPLNALLQPQESITATRVFEVPPNASGLGLVIAHEGGFPVGWFIIGYETWFRKPAIVPLHE